MNLLVVELIPEQLEIMSIGRNVILSSSSELILVSIILLVVGGSMMERCVRYVFTDRGLPPHQKPNDTFLAVFIMPTT